MQNSKGKGCPSKIGKGQSHPNHHVGQNQKYPSLLCLGFHFNRTNERTPLNSLPKVKLRSDISTLRFKFCADSRQPIGKMKPIFCGNFEYDCRQSELERLFRRYGNVDRVDMKSGFAFIYMEDERDAEAAIRALDRAEFGRKGRRLRVEWTKNDRGTAIRKPAVSRRSSANARPSKTLFVINFDTFNTRTRDLERHFEPYGKIVSVRIRRNFAFVQYETEDDACKALEATNMSKLLDRVISVEFSARDDDDRRNGHSPERGRDRPHDRSRDGRRSPSPYRRERGSPDYGRGGSPYKRERSSPDYGHGRSRSRSPHHRERGSPAYGRRRSPSPYRRVRDDPERETNRSPYHKERVRADQSPSRSPGEIRDSSPSSPYRRVGDDPERETNRSPYHKERVRADKSPSRSPGEIRDSSPSSPYRRVREDPERETNHSPYHKERARADQSPSRSPGEIKDSSPENGHGSAHSPYDTVKALPENGHGSRPSPDAKGNSSPYNGYGGSPNTMPEHRDSPNYGGPESPMPEQYRSQSPPAEE